MDWRKRQTHQLPLGVLAGTPLKSSTDVNTGARSLKLKPGGGRRAPGEICYYSGMALDERTLFTDKQETRQGRYQCPKCKRTGDYSIRWVRRSKKDRLPPGADETDRAKFAKLRDYLLRLDDEVACKTCGKKF